MAARHRPGIHVGSVLGGLAMVFVLLWSFSIDSAPLWLQWSFAGSAGVLLVLSVAFNRKVISRPSREK